MVKGSRVSYLVSSAVVAGAVFLVAGCGSGQGSGHGTGGATGGGGGASATGGAGALGGAGARGGATGKGGAGGTGTGAGGQSLDGGGGDAAVDPALLSFCQSVRMAMVSRLGSCDGIPPVIAKQLLNIDPCAAWEGAIAAGTLLFDATNASACATALQAQTWACDADAVPDICNGVLQGLVATGGACNMARQETFFTECQSGEICLPGGGSNACQGTCTNLALLGQSCASVPCTAGETCDLTTFTCAPKGSNGDACGGAANRACGQGLYCNDLVDGGTCQPQHAKGNCTTQTTQIECTPPNQCVYGFDIVGTCQPLLQPGDACTNGDFDCPNTMHCAGDNTCQPGASIGQPCLVTGDGEQILCVTGTCNTNAGTIANPNCTTLALGATCVQSADCGPNTLCAVGSTDSFPRCTPTCF
jgi:hypothetical protein